MSYRYGNEGQSPGVLPAADILAAGLVTPVGVTHPSATAALRAGIQRLEFSNLFNKKFQPMKAGFIKEHYLPPLVEQCGAWAAQAPARYLRMLRLATRALQEAASSSTRALPLLLALPEQKAAADSLLGLKFIEALSIQSGVALDLRTSQIFPKGRAGGLVAIHHALKILSSGHVPGVLVGGVDTYLDLGLLAALDAEGRLQVEGEPSHGFIPGESAAFLLLTHSGRGHPPPPTLLARITSVGIGREEGHLYSDKVHRGDGLSDAFREAFRPQAGRIHKVRSVYAGLNGEGYWAKEWGVAYLRHSQHFAESFRIEHPAENIGDPGAALGPLMVAIASQGLRKRYREGPCLVWCSSDREERAALLVESSISPPTQRPWR